MRLIDVDTLGIGKAKRDAFIIPEYADGWNSVIEIVNNAPTIAPASLVKRGRWGNYDTYLDGYRCSCCDLSHRSCTKYCPNCGAKMED